MVNIVLRFNIKLVHTTTIFIAILYQLIFAETLNQGKFLVRFVNFDAFL